MQLNYDCVRDVLLKIEELSAVTIDDSEHLMMPFSPKELTTALLQYNAEEIMYTVVKLSDGGYVDAQNVNQATVYAVLERVGINSLTFDGHQLLDSIRDPAIWEEIKAISKENNISLNNSLIMQLSERSVLSRINKNAENASQSLKSLNDQVDDLRNELDAERKRAQKAERNAKLIAFAAGAFSLIVSFLTPEIKSGLRSIGAWLANL